MSSAPIIKWPGQSGTEYPYYIYPLGQGFNAEAGNYIFAKKTPADEWTPVYIGQTESLKDRLGDHEKEDCAKRNGVTHIHAHRTSSEAARLAEEKDLILNW